jgi:hypothetical protein
VQKRRGQNKGGGQVPINIYVNHGISFRNDKQFTIVIMFYKLDAKIVILHKTPNYLSGNSTNKYVE